MIKWTMSIVIVLFVFLGMTSIGLSVETKQFVSGVSAKIDPLNIDFNLLHDKADAIYDVIDGNDSYLVWNYTTTSGNWAYVFKDGRVAIGSTKELNINNTLWSDVLDIKSMLNNVGAGISDQKIWQAWLSSSIFYAPEKEIFHRFTYEFASNFDLNLFVPECTIKEAILGVSRCDASDNYYDRDNPGQAYAIDGTEVTSCSSNYDCCDVPTADITGKIAPGRHKIVASLINAAHVMYISVITSPMPSKNFTLYSDDKTVWVNELKKSQSMDKFYDFINASYTQHNYTDTLPDGTIGINHTSYPKVNLNVFINKSCAISGGLKQGDFKIREDDKDAAIDSFYFSGNASGQKLDLAIVFDETTSMDEEINALKLRVKDLTQKINSSKLDARYSMVTFNGADVTTKINWTNDADSFRNTIGKISVSGGIPDLPENSLDGIEGALSLGSRPDAQRVIIVVTDEPSQQKGDGKSDSAYTMVDVKSDLFKSGAMLIAVSPDFRSSDVDPNVPRSSLPKYADMRVLANEARGLWIDINSADFSTILEQFKGVITGTYVLEYTSSNLTPNTNRNITVSVNNPLCDGAVGSVTLNYVSPM